MTKRKTTGGPGAQDFAQARAKLKDVGAGLGSLFETVTSLLDEAAQKGSSSASGSSAEDGSGRVKVDYDVQVRSLSDLPAMRSAGSAARRTPAGATSRNRSSMRSKGRSVGSAAPASQGVSPGPVEAHETATGLMLIVPTGCVAAEDIKAESELGAVRINAPGWSHTHAGARPLSSTPPQRTVSGGYLTLMFTWLGDGDDTATDENQT